MNEAKVYLYQAKPNGQFTGMDRYDWEITLAIGDNGNYFGKINGHGGGVVSGDKYPWTDTQKTDLEAAKEFMKRKCDSNSM